MHYRYSSILTERSIYKVGIPLGSGKPAQNTRWSLTFPTLGVIKEVLRLFKLKVMTLALVWQLFGLSGFLAAEKALLLHCANMIKIGNMTKIFVSQMWETNIDNS